MAAISDRVVIIAAIQSLLATSQDDGADAVRSGLTLDSGDVDDCFIVILGPVGTPEGLQC